MDQVMNTSRQNSLELTSELSELRKEIERCSVDLHAARLTATNNNTTAMALQNDILGGKEWVSSTAIGDPILTD